MYSYGCMAVNMFEKGGAGWKKMFLLLLLAISVITKGMIVILVIIVDLIKHTGIIIDVL